MKEFYTLNLDPSGYVLSIAHTKNDNIELDLSKYDLSNMSCYQYVGGELILDKNKLAELERLREKDILLREKTEMEAWLRDHDYIGTKIATGRASIEEYADEIELMKQKSARINEIDKKLQEI